MCCCEAVVSFVEVCFRKAVRRFSTLLFCVNGEVSKQNRNKRGAAGVEAKYEDASGNTGFAASNAHSCCTKSQMFSPVLDTPPLANPNTGQALTPVDGLYKYPQLLLLEPEMSTIFRAPLAGARRPTPVRYSTRRGTPRT